MDLRWDKPAIFNYTTPLVATKSLILGAKLAIIATLCDEALKISFGNNESYL